LPASRAGLPDFRRLTGTDGNRRRRIAEILAGEIPFYAVFPEIALAHGLLDNRQTIGRVAARVPKRTVGGGRTA
jgi:hypothetical protein